MGREVKWGVIYDREEKNISNPKFQPFGVLYRLVSDRDITVINVDFKKGEIKEMTGLLAQQCIKYGKGAISLYNPRQVQANKEQQELEELKAKVAKLTEGKETPVTNISEEVKKTKKKTTKKSNLTTSKDVPGGK